MDPTVHAFLALSLGHLLADFPFQTDVIYAWKFRGWWGLVPHVLVHIVVTGVLFIHPLRYWPLFLGIFVSHYLIDWGKLHVVASRPSRAFLLDQGLHFLSLFLLVTLLPVPRVLLPTGALIVLLLYALLPAAFMYRTIRAQEDQADGPSLPRGRNWMHTARVTGVSLLLTLFLLQVIR